MPSCITARPAMETWQEQCTGPRLKRPRFVIPTELGVSDASGGTCCVRGQQVPRLQVEMTQGKRLRLQVALDQRRIEEEAEPDGERNDAEGGRHHRIGFAACN